MYSNFQPSEPDLSAGMGLLAHLNVEELKDIVNNDGKFEELLKDLKQVGHSKPISLGRRKIIIPSLSLAEQGQ
jgi:hypothetical protein